MMPRQLKIHACLTLVIAVLFYLFFQYSKHQPALAQVNAFADDPYDAIASFAVQFALFTALLSLLRAFRPYPQKQERDNQRLLFVRGCSLCYLSVVITMVDDFVALFRHPSVWIGLPTGYLLAGLTGGMALIALLALWLLHYWRPDIHTSVLPAAQMKAIIISLVSLLFLIAYPEGWHQSTLGELFTVLFGAALLFVPLWAIGMAIVPSPEPVFEDFIDDLAALYRWLKAHAGPFAVLYYLLEKISAWPFFRSILRWLNPRKHPWTPAIVIGIVMGIVLTLGETFGEGGGSHQLGRFAILASVFISLECCGVLLGYALLAQPLGLFRRDAASTG